MSECDRVKCHSDVLWQEAKLLDQLAEWREKKDKAPDTDSVFDQLISADF